MQYLETMMEEFKILSKDIAYPFQCLGVGMCITSD